MVSPMLTPSVEANSEPMIPSSPLRSNSPATRNCFKFATDCSKLRIDPTQPGNCSMILELNNHSTLSKRRGGDDSLGFFRSIQDLSPIIHDFVAADQHVGVKAYDLPLEFAFKPGHDRDHNDQNADPEHHPKDRDQCDQR